MPSSVGFYLKEISAIDTNFENIMILKRNKNIFFLKIIYLFYGIRIVYSNTFKNYLRLEQYFTYFLAQYLIMYSCIIRFVFYIARTLNLKYEYDYREMRFVILNRVNNIIFIILTIPILSILSIFNIMHLMWFTILIHMQFYLR